MKKKNKRKTPKFPEEKEHKIALFMEYVAKHVNGIAKRLEEEKEEDD